MSYLDVYLKTIKTQHGRVPEKWKRAVINKAAESSIGKQVIDGSLAPSEIDCTYDDAIYFLFEKSTQRIINLAEKLGYDEIPCETCRNIIKYYDVGDEMWNIESAHKFMNR